MESEPIEPSDLPVWNFDGSSCYQAEGCNSDVYLHPVALFREPFRRGKNKIVLCETYNFDHKPGVSNHRLSCRNAMEKDEVKVCSTKIHSNMIDKLYFALPLLLLCFKFPRRYPRHVACIFFRPVFFFLGLSPGKFDLY